MTATRPALSPRAAGKLAALESLEVLGASRQLRIIGELLAAVAEEYAGEPDGLIWSVRSVQDYLVATRGQSSQAVGNALHVMLGGLDVGAGEDLESLRERVMRSVREYDSRAQEWMRALTEYGANLLAGRRRVLAYDYSSSVAAILRCADERARGKLTVVVPESRTLDGGRKYVVDLQDTELGLEFIPDPAIATAMPSCDLVLEGAETLSAQGGCYNTTGTLLTALVAQHWRVPFYVASTTIKIDAGTLRGQVRNVPPVDLGRTALQGWEPHLLSRVRAGCPDLDYTPPELIAGFITEEGVLPPGALWQHAARFRDGVAHG